MADRAAPARRHCPRDHAAALLGQRGGAAVGFDLPAVLEAPREAPDLGAEHSRRGRKGILLRRHANVMLDVSSIAPRKHLEVLPRIPEVAGRILWGTDWPSKGVVSMRSDVEAFLSLPLTEEVQRKILFDNAAALYPV